MNGHLSVETLGNGDLPGVLISNLSRADIDDPAICQQLRDLWIEHGVIVFRGLSGTESHLALSRVFGTLTAHPSGVSHNAVHPELSDINHSKADANLFEIGGKVLGAWLPWHSDLVYFAEINRGGILRAITPAAEGGFTGFIDQIAAYERLPQHLKDKIEDLRVIYWGDFRMENARYANVDQVIRRSKTGERIIAKRDQFPRVSHPMVYVQGETGRKVLNISPWFAMGIEGMDDEAGLALLDEIVAHCSDERFAYFHQWQPEDMVLWDNWRMLHRATGIEPDATRIMQRTTILGDYGIGRVVTDTPEAATLERISV